jgi:hypothetical protein
MNRRADCADAMLRHRGRERTRRSLAVQHVIAGGRHTLGAPITFASYVGAIASTRFDKSRCTRRDREFLL